MTDPFKNQKYSFQPSFVNDQTDSTEFSSNKLKPTPSSPDLINRLNLQLKELNEFSLKPVSNKSQEEFFQAYVESNKDLIKQLKSNNELLFKATKILSQFVLYPLSALRWQCQINSESSKFHLTPLTLMPVFYNISYHHGYYNLWKGCFSMAAYNGIKTILESVLSEVTSCEKDIEDVNKSNKLYGHITLKLISSALTTPILSAVVFESVQSGISNENLGLVDLMKETWNRITGYKYNYRTRFIPIWSLIIPHSLHSISFHFLSIGLEKIIKKTILKLSEIFHDKRRVLGIDEIESEVVEGPYVKSLAELTSRIAAIIALYPIETVLYRLMVQGTRTIINNTDNGYDVVPINTRYDGFFDCIQTINETEGFFGFYKGLGALVIESLLAYAILKFGKIVALRIFDSEWTTRCDMNNMKNLMSSNN